MTSDVAAWGAGAYEGVAWAYESMAYYAGHGVRVSVDGVGCVRGGV
jgi:hypothetical protein